jgi:hypothetical protein
VAVEAVGVGVGVGVGAGVADVVTEGTGGGAGAGAAFATRTVIEALSFVPAEFVAVITKVNVPVAVGVPESAPVVELSVRPVGNVPDCTR